MVDAGVHILQDWDVLAVKETGLFVRGEGEPWLFASHEQLMRRGDELARAYREATGPYDER